MEKQVTSFKEIKDLEREPNGMLSMSPFTANGKVYKFIKPGTPIGIRKFTEYEKLKIVAGVGKTFGEIATYLSGHKNLLGADKPFAEIRTEAILATDSMQKGIVEMSKERYNQALYLCTIFIYEDGKDPYHWDIETATQMVEDWEVERINENDLFFFASLLIPGFRQMFKELQEEAERQAENLLGVSGLVTMGA